MAVKIELKRSSVPGKVPTTASLELGEIAINTYDGVAYLKRETNLTQSIVALLTTAFTGSYMESSSYAQTASFAFFAFSSSYANTASFSFDSISSSYALTASYALNAGTTIDTGSLATTGSNVFIGNQIISGSLTVTGIQYLTGSLFGTASWAEYAVTASYIDPANLPTLLSYQIATGSVTASVDVVANQIFLIKSGSASLFQVDNNGNVETSGSITVNTTGSYNSLISVNNNGTEYLKVNGEGVLVLNQFATPPTAVSGGIYLDTIGEFYFGV